MKNLIATEDWRSVLGPPPGFALELLDPNQLLPHEQILLENVKLFAKSQSQTPKSLLPLFVDCGSGAILDGHHRHAWAVRNGVTQVACFVGDYLRNDSVLVRSRRDDVEISKEIVIRRALALDPLPPKSTMHFLRFSDSAFERGELE